MEFPTSLFVRVFAHAAHTQHVASSERSMYTITSPPLLSVEIQIKLLYDVHYIIGKKKKKQALRSIIYLVRGILEETQDQQLMCN